MENVSSVPIYLEDTEMSAWSELSYNYLKPNPLKFFFFIEHNRFLFPFAVRRHKYCTEYKCNLISSLGCR